jgi:hypothetical protein
MANLPPSRTVGAVAIAAGGLMVAGHLAMLPVIDGSDVVGVARNPVYRAAGVAYLVAFCLLQLTLLGLAVLAGRQAADGVRVRGWIGGLVAASVGTTLLGGDVWFETFAVPWLADGAPQTLSMPRGGLLVAGALPSYVLFAVGWVVLGVTALRSRTMPAPLAWAFVVAGVVGYGAMVPPWGIPLGLAVLALGVRLVAPQHRAVAPAPAVLVPGGE